jgi:hypothetical protein
MRTRVLDELLENAAKELRQAAIRYAAEYEREIPTPVNRVALRNAGIKLEIAAKLYSEAYLLIKDRLDG